MGQRCEAVVQLVNSSHGSYAFSLARNLGQASAESAVNTYIFHEIGQCSPKVDFAALVADPEVDVKLDVSPMLQYLTIEHLDA